MKLGHEAERKRKKEYHLLCFLRPIFLQIVRKHKKSTYFATNIIFGKVTKFFGDFQTNPVTGFG